MEVGAGVVSAAGVAALESDALSPLLELLGAASVAEGSGDSLVSVVSLIGDSSSSTDLGSTSSRSFGAETFKVTSRLGLLPDFLRPSAVLLGGAI